MNNGFFRHGACMAQGMKANKLHKACRLALDAKAGKLQRELRLRHAEGTSGVDRLCRLLADRLRHKAEIGRP